MDIFGAIAIALLLLLGRNEIKHDCFTAGTFLAFIIAVFKLYDPVRKFASVQQQFPAGARARRLRFSGSWIPKTTSERNPEPSRCRKFSQSIRFENVCFSYNRRRTMTRARCCTTSTWRCAPAKCLRLSGSSGAGKSTLVHLIPRFFDVTAGGF